MLAVRSLYVALAASAILTFTGCVGPMAHGPLGGCCGPASSCNDSACTGCGELYVDPWINEPANCVDPCDMCGNYNGQSCGRCRPIFGGIRSLWGYKCGEDCGPCVGPVCFSGGCGALNGGGGCGCGGSCDSACGCEASCGAEVIGPSCGCESGGCSCGGGADMLYSDNGSHVIDGGEYIVEGDPMPSQGITIQPADMPYKPERTRKIFNPRPRVATGDGRSVGY